MKGRVKVGLVLCSNSANPIPSTRIAVLNVLSLLNAEGFDFSVIFEPESPSETPDLAGVAQAAAEQGCALVILQKVRGPSAVLLARQLDDYGIRTVYFACDQVDNDMVSSTGMTVTVTEFLRSLCPPELQSKVHVVHDGVERMDIVKERYGVESNARQALLRAVLVTSSNLTRLRFVENIPAWLRVKVVGRYSSGADKLREVRRNWAELSAPSRIEYIRFLANWRIQCVPWHAETVYSHLVDADVGIIPIDTQQHLDSTFSEPVWRLKSENRLTLKMSLGLPVVATPIPSYEPIILHGVNGFFAKSRHDWINCLSALRDPLLRQQIGRAARESVKDKYSVSHQSKLMKDLLVTLVGLHTPVVQTS